MRVILGWTGAGTPWRLRGRLLAAVLAVAIAPTARAEPSEPLQAIVDRIAAPVAQSTSSPALIVGVSWHGKRSVFAYSGTADPPPDANTIFEIGSITKVFTTALFAEALIERRLLRDATLQSLIHEPLKPCTAQVTVEQLATFTSGMPLLPNDAPKNLEQRGIDHYTRHDFFRWVSRWTPGGGFDCNLPEPYRYSNASVGLLGYLVADSFGAPWADLVRDRITGPLGVSSTRIEIAERDRDRAAQGHRSNGSLAPPWPVFAWFAAGALRSTASDMLSFGETALRHQEVEGRPVPEILRNAQRIAMAPRYQPDDQTFFMGMAWNMAPGDPSEGTRPIFYKAGGTDGFSSMITVNPGKDLVVFVAANKADPRVAPLALRLSRFIR